MSKLKSLGFREFTKEDWYGYAGCERFDDNSEPIIAEMENNNFYSVIIISNNSMEIDIGVQEGSTAEYDGIEFGEYETVSLMEYGDAEDLVDSAEEIYHFIKNNSDK